MKLTALIVDDAPVIQMTLRKMLARAGIDDSEIRVASSGKAALDQFHEQRPNVVFMDIRLEDAFGENIAAEMLMERPETKVVIISSLDRQDERVANLISAGAFDVLQKPIHQDQVSNVLRRLLPDEMGWGRIP